VLEEKFNSMSKELEEANEENLSMQKEQAQKWELYHELKEQEVDLTQQREDRLGQIEKAIKEAKKESIEKAKIAREVESRKTTLALELESLKNDIVTAQECEATAIASLKEATEEETGKEIVVGEVKALWDEAKSSLNDFEERLTQFSTGLAEIKREKASLAKKADKCTLEAKKLSVTISRVQKEREAAEKLVASLLKTHVWIASEKSAFGVEGGDYDFTSTDPNEMSRQLQTLRGEQESLVSSLSVRMINTTRHFARQDSLTFANALLHPCNDFVFAEQENQQEGDGNDREGRRGIHRATSQTQSS
jgi:structural maintenance of chromosome 2